MTEHLHDFRPATVTTRRGPTAGKRCACGVEVVGTGPFGLNAQLVRACEDFNDALARGVVDLARRMNRGRP